MASPVAAESEVFVDEDELSCERQYEQAEREPLLRQALFDSSDKRSLRTDIMAGMRLLGLTEAAIARGLIDREEALLMLSQAVYYGEIAVAELLCGSFAFAKADTMSEEGEGEDEGDEFAPSRYYRIEAWSLAGEAAKRGHLEALQWVVARFGYDRDDIVRLHVYKRALQGESMPLVEWLEETFKPTREDFARVDTLWDLRDVGDEMAVWFLERYKPTAAEILAARLPREAAKRDKPHLKTLRWLFENVVPERSVVLKYLFSGACSGGDLELAKEIALKERITLRELGSKHEAGDARKWAKFHEHTAVVAWLDEALSRCGREAS
jgi:hypothetical protein